MIDAYSLKAIYSFFFKAGVRAKRAKLFFFLVLLPVLVFLIIKLVLMLRGGEPPSIAGQLFERIGAAFFFTLLCPLIALFYGSSVISDEVDNRTLVYLAPRPVSRGTIMAGKFLAHLMVACVINLSGMFLALLVAKFSSLGDIAVIKDIFIYLGVCFLATAAYSALFNFLGTIMKKAIVAGFFFFGWEFIVQFIPGVTQKFSISYYLKSLLPVGLGGAKGLLVFRLAPASTAEAIITLLLITVFFLALATVLFYKKEYPLSEQT